MKNIFTFGVAVLLSTSVSFAAGHGAKAANKRKPASNAVCAEKAKAIVQTLHKLEWPDFEIKSIDVNENSVKGDKHNYTVSVGTGGKFDLNIDVNVEASGPNACYLVSLNIPRN